MSYLTRNLIGITAIVTSAAMGHLNDIAEPAEVFSKAHRLNNEIDLTPDYEKGNCDSLESLFRWHGMTNAESEFFFGAGIIRRESLCGADTYNESSGDTGVCQLTHLHSKPGYFFGRYYEQGWAVELFGLYVGKAHRGIMRDNPNHIPACLWLLRGGSFESGIINTDPWNLCLWTKCG